MTAPRRWVAALLAFLFTLSGLVSLATASSAVATSPFDPAPANGATQGTLTLYDALGAVVTGGALSSPPKYAMATIDEGQVGATKASLYGATPQKGVDPWLWPANTLGAATVYPATSGSGVPSNLVDKTTALVSTSTIPFTWFAADGYPAIYPNANDDAAWQNLYQLRIYTSGPGIPLDSQRYSSATISIDEGAGTWTQVFPDPAGTPPTVDVATSITGTAKVGSTLTCVAATFTGADGTPTISWKRSGAAIPGATTTTYKLTATDAKKPIACTTTGTNANGSTPSTSAAKTVALGDALKATKKPTTSGKPRVGRTLTCKAGAWSPKATSYGYQWLRNGKAIKGQTKAKHKIVRGDKGKKISCKVTAKRTGYKSGTATSAAKRIR